MYKKNFRNTSGWNTKDLIKIINRCEEFRGIDLNSRLTSHPTKGEKPFRVKKSQDGRNSYRGRCYGYHLTGDSDPDPSTSGEIYVGVPSILKFENWKTEDTENRDFNKERFAEVVLHEIDHLLGLRHDEMLDSSKLSTPKLSDIEVRRGE